MIGRPSANDPIRIGFYLIPGFSMMAFASAVEPLRIANRISGREIYRWESYSLGGEPVEASNGFAAMVHGAISDVTSLPALFVCGGIGAEHHRNTQLYARLRRLAMHGTGIGAICTGTYVLARAGLLSGYRCTVHWENLAGFAEEFPDIEVISELYEIDRNRFTCSGGTAALDMMLNLIALNLGHDIAAGVADQLMHHRIRSGYEGQRMELRVRLNISHPKLLEAISNMEESIEAPMSCAELARTVSLSPRQLERLFRKNLNRSPTHYYLGLRLDRARFLLLQTSLSILNVALACGFVSASHFSKCYREHFGWPPSDERRQVDRSSDRALAASPTGIGGTVPGRGPIGPARVPSNGGREVPL